MTCATQTTPPLAEPFLPSSRPRDMPQGQGCADKVTNQDREGDCSMRRHIVVFCGTLSAVALRRWEAVKHVQGVVTRCCPPAAGCASPAPRRKTARDHGGGRPGS